MNPLDYFARPEPLNYLAPGQEPVAWNVLSGNPMAIASGAVNALGLNNQAIPGFDRHTGDPGPYPKTPYGPNAFNVVDPATDPVTTVAAAPKARIPSGYLGRGYIMAKRLEGNNPIAATANEGMAGAGVAAAGYLDGMAFGIPKALLRRFLPDTAAKMDATAAEYPAANVAGSAAGILGNPAAGVYRAAGDAIAKKGYGLTSQGLADAATLTGVASVPGLIEGKSSPENAGTYVPVAMAARYMMPRLPDEVWKRVVGGAVAGGLSGLPEMGATGNTNAPLVNALIGGLYGASARNAAASPHINPDNVLASRLQYATAASGMPALLWPFRMSKDANQSP